MVPTARSVYDVCVFDPEPRDFGRALMVGGAIAAFLGDPFGLPARYTVEIVTVDDDDTLMQWKVDPHDAQLLKEKIEGDLDQMDAEQFAVEWGLPTALGEDADSN